ncbi:MAG: hypothetical protein RI897_3958 [Verrucomicrobiota bacterium]
MEGGLFGWRCGGLEFLGPGLDERGAFLDVLEELFRFFGRAGDGGLEEDEEFLFTGDRVLFLEEVTEQGDIAEEGDLADGFGLFRLEDTAEDQGLAVMDCDFRAELAGIDEGGAVERFAFADIGGFDADTESDIFVVINVGGDFEDDPDVLVGIGIVAAADVGVEAAGEERDL